MMGNVTSNHEEQFPHIKARKRENSVGEEIKWYHSFDMSDAQSVTVIQSYTAS